MYYPDLDRASLTTPVTVVVYKIYTNHAFIILKVSNVYPFISRRVNIWLKIKAKKPHKHPMLFTHSSPQSAPHPPLRHLRGSSLVIRLGLWEMGCGYIVGGCRGRWVNISLVVFVFFCIGILELGL